MHVVWLEDAVNDLKMIGDYIAEDDPEAAYRVLTQIQAAADSLSRHPEMGRPGRVEKTRELVISGLPYILPYYIKKNEVRILAVLHTSRKWPGDFSA
ncbi:MAG: type II toxin-antitoxin system RelE/ParE family toxin [Nitrospinae bacterium]|nr:type II toxin-antitoxin system RelE/ParE family toxin [Nitrospinota bacterium]MCH7500347.1 type II toxin-antitoxin system RelE/ParE family toxin [Nitrospinota bacterium]